MTRDHLPATLRERAGHAGRLVGALAAAGARRLLRTSEADDQALGEALVGELDALKGMAMKVGQILSYLDGATGDWLDHWDSSAEQFERLPRYVRIELAIARSLPGPPYRFVTKVPISRRAPLVFGIPEGLGLDLPQEP